MISVEQFRLLVIVDTAFNVETTIVEQFTLPDIVEVISVEQFTLLVIVDNAFNVETVIVEQFALLVIVDAAVNVEVVSEDKEVNVFVHAETPLELM